MTAVVRVISTNPERDWRQNALCSDDPDLWFPHTNSKQPRDVAQVEEAKATCLVCPVLEQCRANILALEGGKPRDQRFGIFAAMTPGERHNLWRRDHRKAA